jgi:AcrR family transcriptional regulator
MARERRNKEAELAMARLPLLDEAEFERAREEAVSGSPDRRRAAQRAAMARAALVLSGECGYETMTVRRLLERSDSNRDRFYLAYADKADCYAAGYGAAIDQFAARLLAAGAAEATWRAGIRAALEELATVLGAEPALVRGLLAEVYVVGGGPMAKRKEVFARLSRAVDRARREIDDDSNAPPRITSDFILSGTEATVLRALRRGEVASFSSELPGLLYMAIAPYFGAGAAQAEVRRLG